jgi:hypothetical protein
VHYAPVDNVLTAAVLSGADDGDGGMFFNEDEAHAAVDEERMHRALERLDARLVVDTSRFDDDEDDEEEGEEEDEQMEG